MPPIRMGFEPHQSLNMGLKCNCSQEMGSILNRIINFSRYIFLALDFLGLSCEDWFVVTFSSINVSVQ